jgi:hypothetical protein
MRKLLKAMNRQKIKAAREHSSTRQVRWGWGEKSESQKGQFDLGVHDVVAAGRTLPDGTEHREEKQPEGQNEEDAPDIHGFAAPMLLIFLRT